MTYKSQQEPRTPEQRWSAFEFPRPQRFSRRCWFVEHLGYALSVEEVASSHIMYWNVKCGDLLFYVGSGASVEYCKMLAETEVRKHALGKDQV